MKKYTLQMSNYRKNISKLFYLVMLKTTHQSAPNRTQSKITRRMFQSHKKKSTLGYLGIFEKNKIFSSNYYPFSAFFDNSAN